MPHPGISLETDARLDLTTLLAQYDVVDYQVPDFSTKEAAQQLAGLDMPQLISDKLEFKKGLMSDWLEEAEAEGRLTDAFVQGLEDHASYPLH